jgi:hypothetical protein
MLAPAVAVSARGGAAGAAGARPGLLGRLLGRCFAAGAAAGGGGGKGGEGAGEQGQPDAEAESRLFRWKLWGVRFAMLAAAAWASDGSLWWCGLVSLLIALAWHSQVLSCLAVLVAALAWYSRLFAGVLVLFGLVRAARLARG